MKNLIKMLSISAAMALSVTFAAETHAKSLDEWQVEAQLACDSALEENTREALMMFRLKYGLFKTSCSSLAFNLPIKDPLEDSNKGGSNVSASAGGNGSNGGGGDGDDGGNDGGVGNGSGHPLIEALREVNADPNANKTLDEMQSLLDSAE